MDTLHSTNRGQETGCFDETVEGFVRREPDLLALSIEINNLILSYERDRGVKIMCSCDAARQYPNAYPSEPKVQLFGVI